MKHRDEEKLFYTHPLARANGLLGTVVRCACLRVHGWGSETQSPHLQEHHSPNPQGQEINLYVNC